METKTHSTYPLKPPNTETPTTSLTLIATSCSASVTSSHPHPLLHPTPRTRFRTRSLHSHITSYHDIIRCPFQHLHLHIHDWGDLGGKNYILSHHSFFLPFAGKLMMMRKVRFARQGGYGGCLVSSR